MSYITQTWLEDQTSIRCLLVEVTAWNVATSAETSFYLSSKGYVTSDSAVTFLPYLTGTLQTTESISIDGSLSMSFGDIQIANDNGDLDSWLDYTKYIWVNRGIKVYLGDPRWASTLANIQSSTTFEKIFDGIIADIDSSARESINIKVRDKLQRLNYPLTDNILGIYGTWAGGQTNQDTIRPLIFGEVHNMSPILVGGTASPEYMFNDTNTGTLVTSTAATTNLITCASTAGFFPNKQVVFTFSTTGYSGGFGGIVPGTAYYIKTVDSATTFTIAATYTGGNINGTAAFTLSNATASIAYPVLAETSITKSESVIEIRSNGTPIYTDSGVFGTSVIGTAVTTNLITCNNTSLFTIGYPVVFTTSIGNILAGKVYYIKTIDSASTFTVSTTQDLALAVTLITATGTSQVFNVKYTTTASSTALTTNLITCASTSTFSVGSRIVFNTAIGGISVSTLYYVKTIDSGTTFTVSLTDGGAAVTLSTASAASDIYIETRPILASVDLTTSKFVLKQAQPGPITASVQGVKRSINLSNSTVSNTFTTTGSQTATLSITPGGLLENVYTNNIANIIALIVTQYGQKSNKLSASDIDLTNFISFATTNIAPIGVLVSDRANVLTVCQEIAASANAQLFFNRAGQLQLLKLENSPSGTITSITDNDILHHSLHISSKTDITAAIKIGYCKNYTVQQNVAALTPGTAAVMFADEWYSNTQADTGVQSIYKLDTTPVQKDTKLIVGSDASALATSLLSYYKVPHTIYAFTGTSKLMSLKLGQWVTLTHNRFGLNSGKSGQVITLSPDWANGIVNVEVII